MPGATLTTAPRGLMFRWPCRWSFPLWLRPRRRTGQLDLESVSTLVHPRRFALEQRCNRRGAFAIRRHGEGADDTGRRPALSGRSPRAHPRVMNNRGGA